MSAWNGGWMYSSCKSFTIPLSFLLLILSVPILSLQLAFLYLRHVTNFLWPYAWLLLFSHVPYTFCRLAFQMKIIAIKHDLLIDYTLTLWTLCN